MQNDGHETGGAPSRVKIVRGRPSARYSRMTKTERRFPGASLADRLRANTDMHPATGCHLWTGSRNSQGYGRLKVTIHRLAWELANGPVPSGMFVLHRCDNPLCCNPDHLFLGSQAENMADKARKGRSRNQWTGKLNKPRIRTNRG